MAKIRQMKKLVRLVKDTNDERWKEFKEDPDSLIGTVATEYNLQDQWAEKEDIIEEFAKTLSDDEQKARDIYGDATSKRYAYIREKKSNSYTQKVDTTSDGRGLLEWGGVTKEYINKNFSVLTIIVSVVGGILLGLLSAYISYRIYKKTK